MGTFFDNHSIGLQSADGNSKAVADCAKLPVLDSSTCGNHVVGGALDLGSEFERRLAVGAQVACQLRAAVNDKLGDSLPIARAV